MHAPLYCSRCEDVHLSLNEKGLKLRYVKILGSQEEYSVPRYPHSADGR